MILLPIGDMILVEGRPYLYAVLTEWDGDGQISAYPLTVRRTPFWESLLIEYPDGLVEFTTGIYQS